MTYPLIMPTGVIVPSKPRVIPGGQVQLQAVGGNGPPYTWALTIPNSGSGASIGSSGLYSAGITAGTIDVVEAKDAQGEILVRYVQVIDGPTLGFIRSECQRRADLVNSEFVTPSEWNNWINAGAYELYDLLVTAYGNDYNVADPYVFMADGFTDRYPLPPDFFKLLGVDRRIGSTWSPIRKFNYRDRNQWPNTRYRITDNWIWLSPAPHGGQRIRLFYVPRMTRLIRETDVLDGVSGWEEYVIVNACIMAKNKQESDVSVFAAQKSDMAGRINQIAENRDVGEPGTVVDVRSQEEFEDDLYIE